MTLIEICVVIVVLIVILTILGHFSSKLNNTVLFLTVIAMCVGIVLAKLGVFLHTLYLM